MSILIGPEMNRELLETQVDDAGEDVLLQEEETGVSYMLSAKKSLPLHSNWGVF